MFEKLRVIDHRLMVSLVVVVLVGTSEVFAQVAPLGPDFQLNSYTTASQWSRAVAARQDGGFVAAWSDSRNAPDLEIRAQLFDSGGVALGTEFRVNGYTTGSHGSVAVAMRASGEFVVVWHGTDATGPRLLAKRFDSSATPLGSEIPVGAGGSPVFSPAVALHDDNRFVVVWADGEVHGQRFDASGSPEGAEFQVNTYTTYTQRDVTVEALGSGRFVVAWPTNYGYAPPPDDEHQLERMLTRTYDGNGAPEGLPRIIDEIVAPLFGIEETVSAASGNGDVAVAWTIDWEYGWGIRARSIGQDGAPLGPLVDMSDLYSPTIAVQDDSGFVLAGSNSYYYDRIEALQFSSSSQSVGPVFHVAGGEYEQTGGPSVVSQPGGEFTIVWSQDDDLNPEGPDLRAIRYGPVCGDSIVVAGESCDDGNLINDDGCDDDCQLSPCVNLASERDITIKPSLSLKRINTDLTPFDDSLSLKGEFAFPLTSSFEALDPVLTGARLVIQSEDGTKRIDAAMPGGSFDGVAGWRVNGAGTKFQYKDKNKPAAINGISKVLIQDRSKKAPNQIKVQVKGRGGSYSFVFGEEPIKATVVVGDGALGECGQTAFVPGDCRFSGSGSSLKCRQ